MFSIALTTLLIISFFNLVCVDFFLIPSPYVVVRNAVWKFLTDGSLYYNFFSFLLLFLLVLNLSGNIPGFNIPTLYYFFTASVSVSVWLALILVVFSTQLVPFLAHMLPYGAPVGLMFFLPIIEVFSHLIRPFTLMVRLSTNLSSGHIILYMFSFFSINAFSASPLFVVLITLLFLLELMISALQAYIFASLSLLYISESL